VNGELLDPAAVANVGDNPFSGGVLRFDCGPRALMGIPMSPRRTLSTLWHRAPWRLSEPRARESPADLSNAEAFVYPNRRARGVKPTLHIGVGIADQVLIRIYDLAGRQLHETTLTGTPS